MMIIYGKIGESLVYEYVDGTFKLFDGDTMIKRFDEVSEQFVRNEIERLERLEGELNS